MEWDEAQTFPLEVIKKLQAASVYMGAIFPEKYGGAEMGYVEYAIIIEELSRVDGSVGIIVAAHTSLCSNHIYKAGTEEQKQKYLPKLASGRMDQLLVADGIGGRFQMPRVRETAAVRDGEQWVINGAKSFTTAAHYAYDVCVGMRNMSPIAATARLGISAFISPKKGTPGFRAGKKENELGLRANATGDVLFTDRQCVRIAACGQAGRRLRR